MYTDLRHTGNTVQRLTKCQCKKEKWDHLKFFLHNVLVNCWPCGFLTLVGHLGKIMIPTLSLDIFVGESHMVKIGANVDNLKMTMKVLHAKRKDLKSKRKGSKPNRPVFLDAADEEKMWKTGALGSSDSETLLHTLWFLFSKCYGFRGCQEFRDQKWGNIKKQDENGETSLEWNERLANTRAGNSHHQRSFPLKYFTMKTSRRLSNCTEWFIIWTKESHIWRLFAGCQLQPGVTSVEMVHITAHGNKSHGKISGLESQEGLACMWVCCPLRI